MSNRDKSLNLQLNCSLVIYIFLMIFLERYAFLEIYEAMLSVI